VDLNPPVSSGVNCTKLIFMDVLLVFLSSTNPN
jgi:hypothetical protein